LLEVLGLYVTSYYKKLLADVCAAVLSKKTVTAMFAKNEMMAFYGSLWKI